MITPTETTIIPVHNVPDTAVSYRLNTHQNGRRRPFPNSSEQFWRQHAGVIGGLLRQEEGITADALFLACQDHIAEFPADGPYPEIDPHYVRWVLLQLIQLGMVVAEQTSNASSPIEQNAMKRWVSIAQGARASFDQRG